ncbi:hypothetical protein, partial [Streptomyces nitrosporeus]|uniref:hypothetical protein n=1 Tax=Streptomyces nitrosporeus TaxID=28894 RepID=UPI0039A215FC
MRCSGSPDGEEGEGRGPGPGREFSRPGPVLSIRLGLRRAVDQVAMVTVEIAMPMETPSQKPGAS